MKIYIASHFKNVEKVRKIAKQLLTLGHEITCTWPFVDDFPGGDPNKSRIVAKRDLIELRNSDAILVYTYGCDRVHGGMHFEAGYALAKGLKIFLMGPPVNVFYFLDEIQDSSLLF